MWRETAQIRLHRSPQNHFNPLPPCGGRRKLLFSANSIPNFNPLPPCGGRHIFYRVVRFHQKFQSTPSVWRETYITVRCRYFMEFQSTPSVWRETPSRSVTLPSAYFNPLPPCGGRLYRAYDYIVDTAISIHSLRVEGDIAERIYQRGD